MRHRVERVPAALVDPANAADNRGRERRRIGPENPFVRSHKQRPACRLSARACYSGREPTRRTCGTPKPDFCNTLYIYAPTYARVRVCVSVCIYLIWFLARDSSAANPRCASYGIHAHENTSIRIGETSESQRLLTSPRSTHSRRVQCQRCIYIKLIRHLWDWECGQNAKKVGLSECTETFY